MIRNLSDKAASRAKGRLVNIENFDAILYGEEKENGFRCSEGTFKKKHNVNLEQITQQVETRKEYTGIKRLEIC